MRDRRRAVLAVMLALPGAVCAQSAPEPIGTARMETDGTIVLDLGARQGGVTGHGRLIYPPNHADFDMIPTARAVASGRGRECGPPAVRRKPSKPEVCARRLRARNITYQRSKHSAAGMIRRHLGGLQPGETKPAPPFP